MPFTNAGRPGLRRSPAGAAGRRGSPEAHRHAGGGGLRPGQSLRLWPVTACRHRGRVARGAAGEPAEVAGHAHAQPTLGLVVGTAPERGRGAADADDDAGQHPPQRMAAGGATPHAAQGCSRFHGLFRSLAEGDRQCLVAARMARSRAHRPAPPAGAGPASRPPTAPVACGMPALCASADAAGARAAAMAVAVTPAVPSRRRKAAAPPAPRRRRTRMPRRPAEVGGNDAVHQRLGVGVARLEHRGLRQRLTARRIGEHLAALLADIDLDVHRQADAQRMRRQLLRIERDPHRHALHHLDPVAGGVLRRQQREGGAGADAQPGHLAVVLDLLAVGIGDQRRRLADAQLPELDFLEVGVDPQLVERHQRHQRRAGLHPLAELHAAPGHVAVDRRRQVDAPQPQIGLAHPRRGALHVRMLLDAGAFGQRAVRRQLVARRRHRRLRRGERALRRRQLGLGMAELLAADGAGGDQRPAPRQVVLRPRHVALQPRRVGLPQRHLRLQRGVGGEGGAHLAHRLRELRLGLVERHLRIGRVEPDQRLAGLHVIGVVGLDREHRAADLRRDLHQVALHIGVVGLLVARADDVVDDAVGDAGHGDHRSPPRRAPSCASDCRPARQRRRRAARAAAAGGTAAAGGRRRRSGWRCRGGDGGGSGFAFVVHGNFGLCSFVLVGTRSESVDAGCAGLSGRRPARCRRPSPRRRARHSRRRAHAPAPPARRAGAPAGRR